MSNFEVPAQKTVRLGKEQKIRDYHGGGDTFHSDQELDSYPYDKLRPELTVEEARHIAKGALRSYRQATEEFEAVKI